MLTDLGLNSAQELFECVPEALRLAGGLDLPPGMAEHDVADEMARLAEANTTGRSLVCFAGAGAYDHDIPAATRHLGSRSEFVTAYTPYQPEASQGVLQALFEYQTLVARLAGLPVANASLYDGASATVEAVNLAVGATGRPSVWVSSGVHPHWRETMATFAIGSGHELVDVPLRSEGTTAWEKVEGREDKPAAVVVASPNVLGCLEELSIARRVADEMGALLVCIFDPISAGLLRSPGEMGADVAVAEGQPLGTPMSFGGPYLGMFAVTKSLVRRVPGRLVGATLDTEGRRSYVTTLRAREQDIRREKASSNVCTNQTLIAVTAMIQLAWLGTSGLRELAIRCARGTRYCREAVLGIKGADLAAGAPTLREFTIRTRRDACEVVEAMADEGFLAGVPVSLEGGVPKLVLQGDSSADGLIISVTEKRTRAEIDAFVASLSKVLS